MLMVILMILLLFLISNTYVLVAILSVRYNQKLPQILSKVFKRSVYWNEY